MTDQQIAMLIVRQLERIALAVEDLTEAVDGLAAASKPDQRQHPADEVGAERRESE
jgi:hypothetical protein